MIAKALLRMQEDHEGQDATSFETMGLSKLALNVYQESDAPGELLMPLMDAHQRWSGNDWDLSDDPAFRTTATQLALQAMRVSDELTAPESSFLQEYGRIMLKMSFGEVLRAGQKGVSGGALGLARLMQWSLKNDKGKIYHRVRYYVISRAGRTARKTQNAALYQTINGVFNIDAALKAAAGRLPDGVVKSATDLAKQFGIKNLNKLGYAVTFSALAWDIKDILTGYATGQYTAAQAGALATTATVEVAASLAGLAAGTAAGVKLGMLVGFPAVGGFLGGAFGSWLGSEAAKSFIETLFKRLFNLSQDAALNEAYAYFDATASTPTAEINKKYRKLAKELHPDKGGSHEEFVKLSTYLAYIQKDRESSIFW